MKQFAPILFSAAVTLLGVWTVAASLTAGPPELEVTQSSASADESDKSKQAQPPATLDEARARARLLHETIHGALQVVHRDFFREGEKLPLPSRSLEDVFKEMARTHGVKIRWMAVNAQAMNVDHEPQDEFEKKAAKALATGKEEFGAVEDGVYRHVGRVRLAAECLGCHVPSRSSNNARDRVAGLVISLPLGNN